MPQILMAMHHDGSDGSYLETREPIDGTTRRES